MKVAGNSQPSQCEGSLPARSPALPVLGDFAASSLDGQIQTQNSDKEGISKFQLNNGARLSTPLFRSLLLVAFLGSLNAFGQKDGSYSEFKAFLSASRPSVEYIKFARSKNFYMFNGLPLTNDVLYEASLQTNTYFIKEVGNLFGHQKPDTSVFGMGYKDYWYINEHNEVSVASRDSQVAGTNAPPVKFNESEIKLLENILDLGLNKLDRSTLSWSGTSFTARANDSEAGTISGRITKGDRNHPQSLEYSYSGKPQITEILNYYYQQNTNRPDWCPHYIVHTAHSTTGQQFPTRTNTIFDLKLGYRKTGPGGFAYQDFHAGALTNGNFVIYSNGVGHILLGTNFEVVETATENPFFSGREWQLKVLFFGFMILSLTAFGWYTTRGHLNKK